MEGLHADLGRLEAENVSRFAKLDLRLAHLETRLGAKIDAVRSEWIGKIETLRWMFGVLVALNGATLIRLFFRQ
jgi:hypothetical protein